MNAANHHIIEILRRYALPPAAAASILAILSQYTAEGKAEGGVPAKKQASERPIMPEAYDREEMPLMPHARAFGAGLIDPAGIPSWIANKVAHTPNTDWYERRMQEARNESPIAAGMGSAVVPALIAGPAFGLSASETIAPTWMGNSIGMGGYLGSRKDEFLKDEFGIDPPHSPRAQAAYPAGGAYARGGRTK